MKIEELDWITYEMLTLIPGKMNKLFEHDISITMGRILVSKSGKMYTKWENIKQRRVK